MSEITGLTFELGERGYQALPIAHGQARLCWEAPYQNTLLELAGEIFPQAHYAPAREPTTVCFSYTDEGGEWMSTSHAANEEEPTVEEFRRIQGCFEYLYTLTNDPSMPQSKRDFLRNLRLPDPRLTPELWRVVNGRLFILWGLAKQGIDGTFSPYLASSDGGLYGRLGISPDAQAAPTAVLPPSRPLPWWKKVLHFLLGTLLCLLGLILVLWLLQSCTAENSRWHRTLPPILGRPPAENTPGDGNEHRGSISGEDEPSPSPDPYNPDKDTESPGPDENVPGNGNDNGGSNSEENVPSPSPDPYNPDKDINSPGPDDNTPGGGNDNGGSSSEEDEPLPSPDPYDADKDTESPAPGDNTPGDNSDNGHASERDAIPPPPSEQRLHTFRVELVNERPDTSGQVSQATFRLSSREALPDDLQVRTWTINGRPVSGSASLTFSPKGGLRYDRNYTLSATVLLNGIEQRVVPYQWNLLDEPTWQIIEDGLERDQRKKRYRLVCCNASTVTPLVRSWQVKFREASPAATELPFVFEQSPLGGNRVAVSWDIGTYKGAYFLELTADLQYATLRGHTATLTHRELIPFVHASSTEELSRAKYEAVINNVYFCLASQTDGNTSNGTAFAISNRRLLTNYHVAVGSMPERYATPTEYAVRPVLELSNASGRTFHARVIASDRARDLALLELCDAQGNDTDLRLPGYLPLATSKSLANISPKTPRHVFALGYPQGTVRMGPPAITDGKTERIERIREIETLVSFTDIQPGYSGGPLIDYASGIVLGINHSTYIEKDAAYKGADLATTATEARRWYERCDK